MCNPGSRKRVIRIFLFVCAYSRFHFLQQTWFLSIRKSQKGKSEQLLLFYEYILPLLQIKKREK